MRGDDHVAELQQRIVSSTGFLVRNIKPETTDLPGAKLFEQRFTLDKFGLRDIDQERAGFEERQLTAANDSRGSGSSRQMQAYAVRTCKQLVKLAVRCPITFFLGGRRSITLRVGDMHPQRARAQCQLAPDLTQPNNTELLPE